MKQLLTLACLLMATLSMSQKPPTCGSSMQPVSSCAAACIHCSIDGYLGTTNRFDASGVAPPGYCTQIVHHIQYVGFVAGSPSLSIRVNVLGCSFGRAIELGIYKTDDCGDFELVSNCNTFMPLGNSYVFTSTTALDVGCPYYLVIDGNGPADCSFSVQVVSGSTTPPPVTFNGPIIGPDHVCQGEEHDFIARHNGACYKMWTVTGGTLLDAGDEDETSIAFDVPGVATICFMGENLCSMPDEICKDVIVHPNPVEVFMGPFEVCEGETYFFDGQFYRAGEHEIDYKTRWGCDSTVILEVEEVEIVQERLEVSRCFPECYTRGGNTICVPGLNRITIQSKTPPFCDSQFSIIFNSIRIQAQLDVSGNLSCGDTLVTLSADSTMIVGDGRVIYLWTDDMGQEIGDSVAVQVSRPGLYCVEIIVRARDGYECSDVLCTTVTQITDDPELQLDTNLVYCLGDTLFLKDIPVTEVNGYSGNLTYHTDFPTPQNRLNNYIIIAGDTTLWAQFTAGQCEDTLIFSVSGAPSPHIISVDTLTFCEGDTVDIATLSVNHGMGPVGNLTFHSMSPPADSNVVMLPYVHVPGDRLFVRSLLGSCDDVEEVVLTALERPTSAFSVDRDTICLGDTLLVNYNAQVDPLHMFDWSWMGAFVQNVGGEDYEVIFPSSGTYTLSLMVDNGFCASGLSEKEVVVEQPLNPLEIECVQTDSVITFYWKSLIGASRYDVVKETNEGSDTRINDTTFQVNQLQNGDSVRITVTAYGPESCGPVTVTLQCKAIFCPPNQVAIDSVPPICLDMNTMPFDLVASVQTGQGMGSFMWSGNGIINNSTGTFDPGAAGLGRHLITCVFSDADCDWRQTTWIEIRPTPVASFSLDSAICIDSVSLLRFDGSAGPAAQPMWNFDGGFVFPGPGTFDRDISWSEPGEKIIELIIEENGCTSVPFEWKIQVESPPDSLIWTCTSTRQTMIFNVSNYIPGATFFNVLTGQAFDLNGDTALVFNGLMPGEVVTIDVVISSENSCADVIQTMMCETEDCPNLQFDLADEILLCISPEDSTFVIPYDLPGTGQGGQYDWTGPALINSDPPTVDLTMLALGSYTYRVVYNEDGCSYSDSVNIIFNTAPDVEIPQEATLTCVEAQVYIGPATSSIYEITWSSQTTNINDSAFVQQAGSYIVSVFDPVTGCLLLDTVDVEQLPIIDSSLVDVVPVGCDTSSDLGSISILNVIGGTPPFTYQLNALPPQNSPMFGGLAEGSYDLVVLDSVGCEWRTTVDIDRVQPITVDLGPDWEIYAGEGVRLDALTNVIPTGVRWTPDIRNCGDCLGFSFAPDSSVTIRIEVIDENGCAAIDEVNIVVKYKKIFVPNSFSPNGDNLNDFLEIFSNGELESIALFEVYDRWGERVFLLENQPASSELRWDGTFNGEVVLPGVYVYRLNAVFKDGSEEIVVGDLTLVR